MSDKCFLEDTEFKKQLLCENLIVMETDIHPV